MSFILPRRNYVEKLVEATTSRLELPLCQWPFVSGRIPANVATLDQMWTISLSLSKCVWAGSQLRDSRGRALIFAATSARRSGLCRFRLVPLGRLSGQVASWVGFVVVGLVSDLSEEPVQGCEPVTLDISAVPGCPAGPTARRV